MPTGRQAQQKFDSSTASKGHKISLSDVELSIVNFASATGGAIAFHPGFTEGREEESPDSIEQCTR